MCSLFSITPANKGGKKKWEKSVAEKLLELGRDYVSPGTIGVVALQGEEGIEAVEMSWGYQRSWSKRPIHNARDDKLDGKTWSESFHERRCLIPMSCFFEWSGPKSSKIKHVITADPDHWFYVAGIWEESKRGHYFSLITTSPSSEMERIHDRMPAILQRSEFEEYLCASEASKHLIRPFTEGLRISPPPELTFGL